MLLVGVIWQQTMGNVATYNVLLSRLRKVNKALDKKRILQDISTNKSSVYLRIH